MTAATATPVVTLLTDFGTADSYVAEMKAAMLAVDARIRFIDVSHAVPPGDVSAAEYLLARAWWRFPAGTVHLAVVDPGVGTVRRAIAATHGGHGFVAPDNGLLTPVLEQADVVALAIPLDAAPTFHGRDVFAAAAARLAAGVPLADLGASFTGWHRIPLPPVQEGARGARLGRVVYVDRFGTLVTNFTSEALPAGATLWLRRRPLGPVRRTLADVEPGQLVAFLGSSGSIEIAVRDGSAAVLLGAERGAVIRAEPA